MAVGLASIGPGIGIGMLTAAYFNAVARQPEVQGNLLIYFFIPLAMVELLGLFALHFILAKG
ncbi:MAG: ATP synthase F0 subunit C [Vampirovibrionales bacterium]